MASELEITKRQFYSDYHNYYNIEKTAIEDSRFLTFTELLDEADVFVPPILARKKGTFKNGNWSLLGYSCESYHQIEEEEIQSHMVVLINGDISMFLSHLAKW